MTYVLDVCWKGVKSDYERGRFTPLSYSVDIYCRSILAEFKDRRAV